MRFDSYLHRNCSLALAFLGAVAIARPLPAQVGLGLAPMRLELRLAPGAQHSGALTLTNDSRARLRVRTELLDFFIDSNETPQFDPALSQEAEFSCRSWLSLNPMEADLTPGFNLPVRYTIRVPQDTGDRSYHCAAGFTTLPPVEQITGTGLRTAVRIVAAFYVVVGQPAAQGGLKGIKLEPFSESGKLLWRAVVLVENRGLMHLRPTGALAVLDEEGKVVETAAFQPLPVLPRREQRFLFPLKAPTTGGRYTLRVRADLGTGEIQEATAAAVPSPNP